MRVLVNVNYRIVCCYDRPEGKEKKDMLMHCEWSINLSLYRMLIINLVCRAY